MPVVVPVCVVVRWAAHGHKALYYAGAHVSVAQLHLRAVQVSPLVGVAHGSDVAQAVSAAGSCVRKKTAATTSASTSRAALVI